MNENKGNNVKGVKPMRKIRNILAIIFCMSIIIIVKRIGEERYNDRGHDHSEPKASKKIERKYFLKNLLTI